eukprot:1276730-Rhodomonas_salina.2
MSVPATSEHRSNSEPAHIRITGDAGGVAGSGMWGLRRGGTDVREGEVEPEESNQRVVADRCCLRAPHAMTVTQGEIMATCGTQPLRVSQRDMPAPHPPDHVRGAWRAINWRVRWLSHTSLRRRSRSVLSDIAQQ